MGAWRIRGQKGYGRRERKEWEVGVLKGGEGKIWGKYGEIMQQYSIFRNRKKSLWEKAKKKRGRSRERKVQELAGLDLPIPPIDYEKVTT